MNLIDTLSEWVGRPTTPPQARVEIYSWKTCPYCIRAKMLLAWKRVEFVDYAIDGDNVARGAMAERANGGRSVPQIFINDQHIGGCDDLYDLDRRGGLDPLLAEAPFA